MAVYIYTSAPKGLLAKFIAAIKQSEKKGKIETWQLNDSNDVTHTSDQWIYDAWMRPTTSNGLLTFNIIKSKAKNVSMVAYGFYHGHLSETFLNHFDQDFDKVESTARAVIGDHCGS